MAIAKTAAKTRRRAAGKPAPPNHSPTSLAEVVAHVVAKIPELGPDRSAALLARVFYRQMRRQGCSERQIIKVASGIIGCLNASLKGLEARQKNS